MRWAEGCGFVALIAELDGDGLSTVVFGANRWGRVMNEQNESASSGDTAIPHTQSQSPYLNGRETFRRANVDQHAMEFAKRHAKKS